MTIMTSLNRIAGFLVGASLLALAGCERPPVESTQIGYRGTAMGDVTNPRDPAAQSGYPAALPVASSDGPRAGTVYQNVQVLGDLSVAEFTRLMTSITEWVSPEAGCNYCHNAADLASDEVYTKVVSRRMIQMTQHINDQWSNHVGTNGVNCYTCHRGQNVPEYIWFEEGDSGYGNATFAGWRDGQNRPVASVAYSTLPTDSFSRFLADPGNASSRIASAGPYPDPDGGISTKEAESSYGLMMSWSASLGVNCTYCHMTASFQNWEQSTPARVTAYHGQDLVRALNAGFLVPLGPAYPDNRLGPHTGDAPKAYCATCHQGVNKPLGGADAISAYPSLASE
jgi:photosynthetic reaction center cytochrome c subunit